VATSGSGQRWRRAVVAMVRVNNRQRSVAVEVEVVGGGKGSQSAVVVATVSGSDRRGGRRQGKKNEKNR